jgi:hypothetical protein
MKEEQYKFMKESKLSPSRVLQDALIYLDTENVTSMLKHNKEIRQAQKRLIQFVQEKGLSEDYSKYVLEQKD